MRKFTKFFLSLMAMLMVTVSANAWKFASAEPANESEVESLDRIVLKLPADAGWLNEFSATFNLTDQNGTVTQCNFSTMSVGIVDTDATFQKITTPGTYTLTIPAGSLHYLDANWAPAEANEAQTFTWTIKGSDDQGGGTQGGGTQGGGTQGGGGSQTTGWSFTNVTPAEGAVDDLSTIVFEMPQSVGGANESANLNIVDQNGTTYKYYLYDNYGGAIHANYVGGEGNEPSKAGTYTLTIPAATFSSYMDGATNAEMTFSWTIAGSTPEPQPTKDYTVSYDKANGIVKLTWPEGTVIAAADQLSQMMHPTIPGYENYIVGGNWNSVNVIEVSATLADGDWTITFPAGDFTINGTPNAAISETFTVGGTQGGGETFEGEKSHEQIFKAGETSVTKNNIVLESDGVKITTVDGEFTLGGSTTTIPFGYNTYDEKELDWKNKCKFVITSKKDAISKIIFVPTASGQDVIAKASADKGEYNNGVWEGKLAAGETLTLTASDGIQIKDIYVCYNGDDFDPAAGGGDDKGVITVQWPTENMELASISDGGTLAKFTTNKDYAQVTVELRNVNSTWHNLYDLPMRYMDGLAAGEHTCTTSTPGTSDTGGNPAWKTFIGDSYELVVKGFINYWDVQSDNYDAMVVVPVVGTGKEHEVLSTYQIIKITPETATDLNVEAPRAKLTTARDNTVTFEFDGPVSAMTASVPAGAAGGSGAKLSCAKANDEGTIWNITVTSGDIGADESFFFNVTAKDNEGHFLDINPASSEHTLGLFFEVTSDDIQDGGQASLGAPAFSIANDAEDIDPATTTSISVTFPNATGYASGVVATVHGTLAKNDMSEPVSFEENGTVAGGVTVPVTLEAGKAYTFTVTSIALAENTTVEGETFLNPIGTYNTNYNVLFYTAGGQGGGTGDNILGEATFTAGETGITVAWPNAQLDGTGADYISFGEWTLTHKGVDYVFYPEAIEADLSQTAIEVEIPYTKIAVYDPNVGDFGAYIPVELAAGDEITVTIPVEAINVYEGYNPAIYINAAPITGTVKVPGDEPQPTSVVLYEKGVNPEVPSSVEGDDARDLVIEGTDVTLAISNTSTSSMGKYFNNAYINNSRGGIVTTNTNVMKFTSSRTIEKIEFTANRTITQKTGTSCVGTFADNVWTGEASEISIAIGQNTTNISKIVVYFKSETPKVKATMSISAAKWGTFVAPFEVTIPAGVTAYKVTDRNEGVLELEEVATTIPANTPVVVNSESTVNKEFEGVAVDGTPQAGMLVGVYDETQVAEGSYVLQNHDGVVGFYKVGDNSNKTVKANRCYLVDSSNARAAYFFTEEDATAINGINADVLGAEGIYNASGVRVNSLQKGLNIIKTANGTKKVMIK